MNKFKETEMGNIPGDWGVSLVEEVAQINELSIGKSFKYDEIEYIDIESVENGNIFPPKKMRLSEAPSRAKRIVRNHDILISTVRPNLKHFAFVKSAKSNTIASTGFVVISPTKIEPMFLYYCLTTERYTNHLSGIADSHTSTYPSFNPDIIQTSRIPNPPLSEQRAIAKILSDLDAKIELNNQMNKTLEEMAQAIFKHWFVDFEFPNEAGKPYKSSGGKMVDSELGAIPKGWNVVRLSEHISFNRGCAYTSEGLQESENALVTLKSIERGGGFKADGFKPYMGNYKSQHIVKNGDIVVAHTDLTQNAEVLGKPAIVREISDYKKLIASMDLGIVRPNNESISGSYLYYLLKTDSFQNHAYGYASGTTVLHLSSKAIPGFVFVLPQKENIQHFSNIAENIIRKIQQNFFEAERLIEVRDSLLPRLMSGKIRVSV